MARQKGGGPICFVPTWKSSILAGLQSYLESSPFSPSKSVKALKTFSTPTAFAKCCSTKGRRGAQKSGAGAAQRRRDECASPDHRALLLRGVAIPPAPGVRCRSVRTDSRSMEASAGADRKVCGGAACGADGAPARRQPRADARPQCNAAVGVLSGRCGAPHLFAIESAAGWNLLHSRLKILAARKWEDL